MAQATLIRGGTVVTAEEERRADVLVVGEAIAAVGEDLDAPAGCATIDAGGKNTKHKAEEKRTRRLSALSPLGENSRAGKRFVERPRAPRRS